MARERRGVHPYLTNLRRLAASFPETAEVEAWGHPTFRVRNKIFASFGERDGRPTLGDQAILTQDARFCVSPYVGKHGWIGILLDEVGWEFVADLVESSYRLIAFKRLVRAVDDALG